MRYIHHLCNVMLALCQSKNRIKWENNVWHTCVHTSISIFTFGINNDNKHKIAKHKKGKQTKKQQQTNYRKYRFGVDWWQHSDRTKRRRQICWKRLSFLIISASFFLHHFPFLCFILISHFNFVGGGVWFFPFTGVATAAASAVVIARASLPSLQFFLFFLILTWNGNPLYVNSGTQRYILSSIFAHIYLKIHFSVDRESTQKTRERERDIMCFNSTKTKHRLDLSSLSAYANECERRREGMAQWIRLETIEYFEVIAAALKYQQYKQQPHRL